MGEPCCHVGGVGDLGVIAPTGIKLAPDEGNVGLGRGKNLFVDLFDGAPKHLLAWNLLVGSEDVFGGVVAVSVVARNTAIPAGVALAGLGWLPTPVLVTSSAIVGATSGGVAQVSLRITALTGEPRVDDVFIDPWNRR